MSRALAKIQQFCTFAHKSGAFAESLENAFGNEVTLKTEIKTRWNYQFIAAEHFMSLHAETFEKAVDDHGSNKLNAMKLQAVDRECVQDVLNALQDFQEATLRNSADKQPTITHVLPLLLGIINNLQQLLPLSQWSFAVSTLQNCQCTTFWTCPDSPRRNFQRSLLPYCTIFRPNHSKQLD